MKKHFQMVMYGEPGVGKSVFGIHTPNPFFITTDGNYEWLDKWGAKDEDHQRVSTWAEFKNVNVSGKIVSTVFEVNKVQAVGGSMILKPAF